jgi:murein DD-endopeptidase MepM/ murein hydrolase activator NlpD
MSRLLFRGLAFFAWGWAFVSHAQLMTPTEEREKVRQRLGEEKAGLSLLKSQQVGVLDVLEVLEGLSRESQARKNTLTQELVLTRRRLAVAERQDALAKVAQEQLMEKVSPRLLAMYRTSRGKSAGLLLSSSDFSALLWRARALSTVLDRDLALLAELKDVSALAQRTRQTLTLMKEAASSRLSDVRSEDLLATAQREELGEALVLIKAEAKQSARVIRELEVAERNLSRMMDDFGDQVGQTGFGAQRGKLPFPTEGILEVAFGKMVNPRFNTVTVQKGIDVRARLGTPVKAVAPGKVVFGDWLRGYGNVLIVDHGEGFHSLMAHLADFTVPVGAEVIRGQELGAVGDTGSLKGAYLYFELRHKGQAIDPLPWLSGSKRR